MNLVYQIFGTNCVLPPLVPNNFPQTLNADFIPIIKILIISKVEAKMPKIATEIFSNINKHILK